MFSRAARAAAFDRKAFTEAFFDDEAAADGAIVVASVGAITYLGLWLRGVIGLSVQGLLQSLVAALAREVGLSEADLQIPWDPKPAR